MSTDLGFDALRYVLLQLNESDRTPLRLVCSLYNDAILSTIINEHVHRLVNNGNIFSAYYHISRPRKSRTRGVSIHYKLIIKNALRNGYTKLIKYMHEFRSLTRKSWMFEFLDQLTVEHNDKMTIFLLQNIGGDYPNLESMIIKKRGAIIEEMFVQGYTENHLSWEHAISKLKNDKSSDAEKIIDVLIKNYNGFSIKTPNTATWYFMPELVRKLYLNYSDNERRILYPHIINHNKELLADCLRCVDLYKTASNAIILIIKKELGVDNIKIRLADSSGNNLFAIDLSRPISYSYCTVVETVHSYRDPDGLGLKYYTSANYLYDVKPEEFKKYKIKELVIRNIHNK